VPRGDRGRVTTLPYLLLRDPSELLATTTTNAITTITIPPPTR